MMPRRQTRRVQREPCLARQCSTERLSPGKHCRAFRPQTERLSKLLEVPRVHFFSFEIRLDVSPCETRLLKRELRGAGEGRSSIRKKSNITQREDVHVLR